jgi:hypothetical protein
VKRPIEAHKIIVHNSTPFCPSRYSACIRRANGYCCVEYSVCEGEPSAFSLDGLTANAIQALLETNCKLDYISIPGIELGIATFH